MTDKKPTLTTKQLRAPLTTANIPGIMKAVADVVRPLQQRIRDLEAQATQLKYAGVWKSGTVYRKGNFVTRDGSLWHANFDNAFTPGDNSGSWTLAVKRGGNAK